MIINDAMTVQDQRTSKIILAIAAITILLATVADKMPSGMIGALGIMVISGFILNYIGDRTPIINQFFGGGAIVVIFGSAYLFHSNIFPSSAEQNITTFMKSGGFLAFYVASLVTGSIFGMDTQTLKKAALKYIPVILGSAFFACILTGLVGMLVSAVANQIVGSISDATPQLARTANQTVLNTPNQGLLNGPYAPTTDTK